MEVENGTWIMQGVDWDDPNCIHTVEELLRVINDLGFLPLFSNEVKGFSVEEMTDPACWWTGDTGTDPWEWRAVLARRKDIAYGKFFNKKAGFISKKWFPYFANYRRDGYDFDARFEDGKAEYKENLIMALFQSDVEEMFSYEIKSLAGFGKGGEKNFEGTLAKLQMQTYLTVRDFRQKVNKRGEGYGWAIAVYTLPECLWGHDFVTGRYSEEPKASLQKIIKKVRSHFRDTDEKNILRVII